MTEVVGKDTLRSLLVSNEVLKKMLDEKLAKPQSTFLLTRKELEALRLQLVTYEFLANRLQENSEAAIRYLRMLPDDPEPNDLPTPSAKKICPLCSRDLLDRLDRDGESNAYYCPNGHGVLSPSGRWRDY